MKEGEWEEIVKKDITTIMTSQNSKCTSSLKNYTIFIFKLIQLRRVPITECNSKTRRSGSYGRLQQDNSSTPTKWSTILTCLILQISGMDPH